MQRSAGSWVQGAAPGGVNSYLRGKNLVRVVLALVAVALVGFLLSADRFVNKVSRAGQRTAEIDDGANEHEAVHLDKTASYIQLHNGIHMPLIGFGTAALPEGGYALMAHAVTHGYHLLDTASDTGPWYHTEKSIGQMMGDYEVQRPDLFITTKLHPQDFGRDDALRSFEASLRNLKSDYVDLYLLHYPECWGDLCAEKPKGTWRDAWRVFEELYEKGRVKSIGVSNFSQKQLAELLAFAQVKPHVVQTWFDPFHQDWELISYCRREHVVFQAFSPLGTQWRKPTNPVFRDQTIAEIAKKHNKSPAQVTLRWMLQESIATLPRSSNPEHIEENMDIFDFQLAESDMVAMRGLHGKISRG